MKTKKRVFVGVVMEEALKEMLRDKCKLEDVSMSRYICRMLRRIL